MATYLALRDRRLAGGVPARSKLAIVNTDGSTPLAAAFGQINSAARHAGGRLGALFILCHGYAGANHRGRVSMDAGGMGLQLGREDLTHSNVANWTTIRDKVSFIVVYSCGAADTQRGNEGTTADGRYLMGALALHARADVYAADRIQWYSTHQDRSNGRMDFGNWEGQLLRFPADGSSPAPVAGPPVEFAHVMAGTAP